MEGSSSLMSLLGNTALLKSSEAVKPGPIV
jgi:hypothetical protein